MNKDKERVSLLEKENKALKLEVSKLQFLLSQQTKITSEHKNVAEYDFLTKVYNRMSLTKSLHDIKLDSIKQKFPFVVIFVDLDNFKQINDNYSHKDGDNVLIEVANALILENRANSIVGRLGGEEFAVVIPGVKENIGVNIAERIRKAIEDLTFQNLDIKVTASIGVYEPSKNDSIETILHKSDKAMYFSKKNGKNKVTKYSDLKKPKSLF